MATVNDILIDRMIKHQIYLERHKSGVANDMVKLLNRLESRVLKQLEKQNISDLTIKRKNELLIRVRKLADLQTAQMVRDMRAEARALAKAEAEFQSKLLKGTMPIPVDTIIPSPQQLNAAIAEKPFNGRILKNWFDGMRRGVVDNMHIAIQSGYAEGATTDAIVRSIKGTRAQKYTDGITEKSRRWVRTVVRTSLNHSATTARELSYEQNKELIKGVQWVSTLDSRTSLICITRDGKTFKPGEGPRPPAHPNCRSTTVPIVKSWKELGINLKQAPPGTRASLNGQVPAQQTYTQFFAKQNKSFQEDVLGVTRAKLFRQGKLPLERFVDRSGQTLTLNQLYVKESSAFERAGL